VKSLGADEIIDYRKKKFDEVLSGFDAALDTIGGDTYRLSFKVLKRGGRLVSMLQQPDPELMKQYGVEASVFYTQVTTERLNKLTELIDQSALRVSVEKTFPLEQAAAALDHVQKESPQGKVVVTIP
jgi:NADPH:quinone reductase-like Zn-dependent oxidoreductase